jgi:hypothetical protein
MSDQRGPRNPERRLEIGGDLDDQRHREACKKTLAPEPPAVKGRKRPRRAAKPPT